MDYGIVYSANKFLSPLYQLVTPQSRIYIPYLISSFLIAIILQYLQTRKKKDPLDGGRGFFPRDVYAHSSARTDYLFFICNSLLYTVIIAPFSFIGGATSYTLYNLFNKISEPIYLITTESWLITAVYTILIIMAADFGTFLAHYFCHRIPIMWEFHKVHHSAEVLTPITVYRMHPVDDILTICIGGLVMGVTDGLVRFFVAPNLSPLIVYGLNVILFLFYALGYNLRHSHIWVSYGPFLSKFLISPAQHQVHHSVARKHWEKNFGFIFALWDWMFGTLYIPKEKESITFGIDGKEDKEFSSTLRLYFLPFVKVAKRFKPK